MELIIIIAIIAYIIKAGKKAEEQQKKYTNSQAGTYQMPRHATRVNSPRSQVQQQNADWQKEVQANIAKAKNIATEKLREFERDVMTELHSTTSSQEMSQRNGVESEHFQKADYHRQQENRSAMQQVHKGRVEARTTTINERAKVNTDAKKADITLETMEAEHNHSERVAAAVHHHPEDVMPESMLGNIEDLMIKGYDGNLCFERDFVGEGLDMISRFTVPSDVPDFS